MTKKLRRSKQRSRMLELLRQTDTHPTATWLYDELRKEFPTVSLGNVYRNLSILVEQEFVHKLDFGSTFDRYEAATEQHAHFVCRNCNRIYDLPMPDLGNYTERMNTTEGHELVSARIEFFGLCRECNDGVGESETDE
ncbi:MAG: Fur family transcriptional regulator [Spirochaetota bacterium]